MWIISSCHFWLCIILMVHSSSKFLIVFFHLFLILPLILFLCLLFNPICGQFPYCFFLPILLFTLCPVIYLLSFSLISVTTICSWKFHLYLSISGNLGTFLVCCFCGYVVKLSNAHFSKRVNSGNYMNSRSCF